MILPQRINNSNSTNFFLLAGPCAVESRDLMLRVASEVKEICLKLDIPYIMKGPYKKANRSRLDSFTGIGDEKALIILKEVGEQLEIPVVTDVHTPEEVVNVKKGQFLGPESMQFAVNKVLDSGNQNVWITERGTTFGYQDLVVDMRGIPQMKNYAPVVMDVTHSLQQPNQSSGVTGGKPELIETIAKSAIAAGADGLFIETHPDPKNALSDGANMLDLANLESLLRKLVIMRKAFLETC